MRDTAGSGSAAEALAAAGGPPAGDGGGPLLVLVNDPARATDSASALRAIRAAVGDRPLHLLVATGSHRFSAEVRQRHERELLAAAGSSTQIAWHDALDDPHVVVGPGRIDARLAAARSVVAIGSVEPHWFAGLTGAHKTLTIGVMAREDIAANHRLALDPAAAPLRLAGNPVHEAVVRQVRAIEEGRHVLGLVHLGGRWFAGPVLDCLDQAAPAARSRWLHTVDGPYDLVVAHVDPPLDSNLYQADKGVKHTECAVRDGGCLVLVAECGEGIGPDRFVELLRAAPDAAAARGWIDREGYRLGDHKAVRLRALTDRGVALALVSRSMDPERAAAAGFTALPSLHSARRWAQERIGAAPDTLEVRDAGHLVVAVP